MKEETLGVNARKKVRAQLGIPSLGDAGSNPGLILTMEEGAAETETLELLSVHKENHPHSSSVTGRLVCKGTITLSRHVNEGEATGVIRVGDITLLLCHIVRKSEANKVQRAPFQNQATIMIPRHVFFFCCSRPQRSTASAGNINKGEPGRTTKQVKKPRVCITQRISNSLHINIWRTDNLVGSKLSSTLRQMGKKKALLPGSAIGDDPNLEEYTDLVVVRYVPA